MLRDDTFAPPVQNGEAVKANLSGDWTRQISENISKIVQLEVGRQQSFLNAVDLNTISAAVENNIIMEGSHPSLNDVASD